jgi:TQXA domain-containing protein
VAVWHRLLVAVAVLGFAAVALTTTASARVGVPQGPVVLGPAVPGVRAQLTGLGTGLSGGAEVQGGVAPAGFDPIAQSYPSTPLPNSIFEEVGWIGTIRMTWAADNSTFEAYCMDILTETSLGYGYRPATAGESERPNTGYIARILANYYPNVPSQPASEPNSSRRAAAVQAAIWYFSDGFVLNATSSTTALRATVEKIVNDVRTAGPLTPPAPPVLSISGPTVGAANTIVGPFTVTAASLGGNFVGLTARASAPTELFADAAGTTKLTAPLGNGGQFWMRSPLGTATVTATGTVTGSAGSALLFVAGSAPASPSVTKAQTLVLASTATVTAFQQINVTLHATGDLTLSKSIRGSAAGLQGPITLNVECAVLSSTAGATITVVPPSSLAPFVIPAGTSGSVSTVYSNLLVPSLCRASEAGTGANSNVVVVGPPRVGAVAVCGPSPAPLGTAAPAIHLDNVFETPTIVAPTSTAPVTTIPTTGPNTTCGVSPTSITGGDGGLPATGASTDSTRTLGLALVVFGLALVVLVRVTRRQSA